MDQAEAIICQSKKKKKKKTWRIQWNRKRWSRRTERQRANHDGCREGALPSGAATSAAYGLLRLSSVAGKRFSSPPLQPLTAPPAAVVLVSQNRALLQRVPLSGKRSVDQCLAFNLCEPRRFR